MEAQRITGEQAKRLIDHAKSEGTRNYVLVRLAIETGARPAECAGWTWRTVCDAAGEVMTSIRFQTRKRGNVREVALSGETVAALRQWKAENPKAGGRDWLFPGPNGRMVDSSMRALLSAIARRAGLDASGYSLRHLNLSAKAAAAVAAGGTVADFARYSGHKGSTVPLAYFEANSAAQRAIQSASVI